MPGISVPRPVARADETNYKHLDNLYVKVPMLWAHQGHLSQI